ncbi:prolyl-tRNA synthetase associated domain-containing protein [Roseomonas xinghualingensis]|uniref:prolyl-tRNA synthetase associated domain-containing protein n=1 Tax=Roseomonas xinghualingensis TaxID=2986475 RepID=UPI0021F1BA20|nr:prolyl-tRNA synthetase associated domain-containing protein [Roseomonas sp. SXEYE001]MCV4208211.1 prolyl-tRNA synthetase associated domain-containing protein [Roseomonas sp. SXEYE001]
MPQTPEALLARLSMQGIEALTHRHPPLHTVAESKELRGDLPGLHVKNLFLRAKPPQPFLLVVAEEDTPLSINALARRLGTGRLSMANEEELWERLGVRPGSVTPLALVNAPAGSVRLVMDHRLLDGPGPVNVHPLTNTATTALRPADLRRFLEGLGHPPEPIDLTAPLA